MLVSPNVIFKVESPSDLWVLTAMAAFPSDLLVLTARNFDTWLLGVIPRYQPSAVLAFQAAVSRAERDGLLTSEVLRVVDNGAVTSERAYYLNPDYFPA